MTATEFSRLMNRFYAVATDVLVKTNAFIDKLVGDEVIGIYLPSLQVSTMRARRPMLPWSCCALPATVAGPHGCPWAWGFTQGGLSSAQLAAPTELSPISPLSAIRLTLRRALPLRLKPVRR